MNPLFGAHITVLDGRVPVKNEHMHLWKKYQGKVIEFKYSPDIQQNWKFFHLTVQCEMLRNIRAELGLNPNYNFHITVGRIE